MFPLKYWGASNPTSGKFSHQQQHPWDGHKQHGSATKSEATTFVHSSSDPCAEPKWKQKLAAADEHQEKTRQATAQVLLIKKSLNSPTLRLFGYFTSHQELVLTRETMYLCYGMACRLKKSTGESRMRCGDNLLKRVAEEELSP